MEQRLLEKLEEFGLAEKEAKVYFAALELGNSTAEKLAKQAAVNRSTTYVQIEALMEMGLMSTHEVGKKTMYTAESPQNLKRLYERKQEQLKQKFTVLETFLPELSKFYNASGERPLVRFFQGREGLITMRNEVLRSEEKKIYMAFSFDELWALFADDMESLYAWSAERAKRKIHSSIIYTKSGDDVKAVALQELRRVSNIDFPFESDIYIFDNKVAMASLKGNVAGVIIENKALANTMKSLFLLAWESAGQN